ncbi:unnamed protein product [Rhizoctonia solani]|uniref:BTB domain-containing protein n=1 Tax=Rhizoctonia solani TaxID=456999 RepID=A0A8H3DZ10_9AGAM|nr:unnamed protein product [Rhizoctonia solani]
MEYEPKYTVVLRGQEFILTKSQIEFDSPNYFTSCFLGDFQEAKTKRLELSRNPDLFKLIIEHLCGYEILPLDEKSCPSHMPPDIALRNIRADALFYQLDGLVRSCDGFIKSRKALVSPSRKFLVIGHTNTSRHLRSTGPNHNIPVTGLEVVTMSLQRVEIWTTIIADDMFNQMGQLQLRKSHVDFEGLRLVAAIEAFVRKAVGNYQKLGWTLLGWRTEPVTREGTGIVATKLLIVLRS